MAEAHPEDGPYDTEYRLLLVGVTGSGKSSTGNSILGKNVFQRKVGWRSGTKNCQLECAIRDNMKIEVVDTPGFCDRQRHNKEISAAISKTVAQFMAGTSPGPHAVLVVMKATERYSTDMDTAYKEAKVMLGNLAQHIVVVFTCGDILEEEGLDIDNEIKATETDLEDMMKDANGRYVVFDNKANEEKKKQQLGKLIELVKKVSKDTDAIVKNKTQDNINEVVSGETEKVAELDNLDPTQANNMVRKNMAEKDTEATRQATIYAEKDIRERRFKRCTVL